MYGRSGARSPGAKSGPKRAARGFPGLLGPSFWDLQRGIIVSYPDDIYFDGRGKLRA